MSYKFVSKSKSDPNGKTGGLGFNTYKEAENHSQTMNRLIENYPDKPWNTEFWKTKPAQWETLSCYTS